MKTYSKHIIFFALLFTISFGFGQETRLMLNGMVKSLNNEVEGVHILNLTSKRGTITDSYGRFSIGVISKDTLLFSSVQLKHKYLVVTEDILSSNHLRIDLEELINELEEVVVRPYNLTGILDKDISALRLSKNVDASSLGLPNADVRVLSQYERKLFEADNGKFVNLYGHYFGLGISINLHKILNRASGRTKKLKKLVEQNEQTIKLEEFEYLFNDSLRLQELKIPFSKKEQFFVYCLADSNFVDLIEAEDHLGILELIKKKSKIFISENRRQPF